MTLCSPRCAPGPGRERMRLQYDVVSTDEGPGLADGTRELHALSRAEIELPADTDSHSEGGTGGGRTFAAEESSIVLETSEPYGTGSHGRAPDRAGLLLDRRVRPRRHHNHERTRATRKTTARATCTRSGADRTVSAHTVVGDVNDIATRPRAAIRC